MANINYLDLNEFVEKGYLQEVNRRFFHPLGLALEAIVDIESGDVVSIGRIWDYRDDPEGILLSDPSRERFEYIQREWESREPSRRSKTGFMVQPVDKSYVIQDG